MKVRFLKSGKQAHSEPARGNFEFTADKEMSGLSEETANNMKISGNAEILGEDDVEEEVNKEAPKSDATITTGATGDASENGASGDQKPWNK